MITYKPILNAFSGLLSSLVIHELQQRQIGMIAFCILFRIRLNNYLKHFTNEFFVLNLFVLILQIYFFLKLIISLSITFNYSSSVSLIKSLFFQTVVVFVVHMVVTMLISAWGYNAKIKQLQFLSNGTLRLISVALSSFRPQTVLKKILV